MIRHLHRAAIATFMALTLSVIARSSHADIDWTRDIASARVQAQRTGKPIFIDFYTDWCGWCKKLDSDVYPNGNVQNMARNFIMVKLNAEAEGESYARAFGVTGFPTMVFLDSQSRYVAKIPGYVEAGDLSRYMSSVVAKNRASTQAASPSSSSVSSVKAPVLYRGPQVTRRSAPRKRGKLPDMRDIAGASGNSGVFLLDEDGAVALDAPVAKKKPVKAKVAAKKTRK